MPTYNFIIKSTGEIYSEFMSISELDLYLSSHPEVEQTLHMPAIISGIEGHNKPDHGFRDLLKDMARVHNSKGGKINTHG